MILVDVIVPSLDQVYDFQLDENAQIVTLIEEISEMICHKEQCAIIGSERELMLCQMDMGRILPKDRTLNELGIHAGNRLMLV